MIKQNNCATQPSLRNPKVCALSINPRVSIIINNHNYGRFLRAAIESALAQTYDNCEVIVVDDGSVDNSRQVAECFLDRISLLLQENAGQVSTFNAGFKLSTGSLVYFLDSDDVLFESTIETAVSRWAENTALLQFRLEILKGTNEPTGLLMPRCDLPDGERVLPQLLSTGRYIWPPTSGNIYARAFLDQIFPIPEHEWEHGDAFINIHAPFYGRVLAIQKPLAYYRIHGKSMSSVTHSSLIDTMQLTKLLKDCEQEEHLLRRVAETHGVDHQLGIGSSWMKLKIKLALCKLTARDKRDRGLLKVSLAMLTVTASARELSFLRKLQFTLWTTCVTLLPTSLSRFVIKYAFDAAPSSVIIKFLRRI